MGGPARAVCRPAPRPAGTIYSFRLRPGIRYSDGRPLRAGDYSDWFRRQIRDDELADETAAVEEDGSLPPDESRRLIAEAMKRRYTGPADAPD